MRDVALEVKWWKRCSVRFDMSKGTKKGFGDAQSGCSEPWGCMYLSHTTKSTTLHGNTMTSDLAT